MRKTASPLLARVVPDVTGLDKEFDYIVPDRLRATVTIGTIVRVELHGRRIGGWVRTLRTPAADEPARDWKPIAKVTGHGPDADLFGLADWAAHRWAAGRIRPFLVAASPHRAVRSVPAVGRHTVDELTRSFGTPDDRRPAAPVSPATAELLVAGGGVLRLPPRADVLPAVRAVVAHGPAIVVAPSVAAASSLATRLRAEGVAVALLPEQWAAAAAGVDAVIGTRIAAWGPCPGLAAAIVVDEHDEALQEERAPTWHARDVLAERCRRAGAPFVAVSPVPTLTAIETVGGGRVVHPPHARERRGWAEVEVVDRTGDRPWARSLATSELIAVLRSSQRVVCVINTTGRGRVLACRACTALLRCERCDAAVALVDDGDLECPRCDARRPPVCQVCGAGRFANLRPGVTRLREEFEAAAARPVVAVTGSSDEVDPAAADVFIGTEAVLHRIRRADVVVFLEFDSELLAPRLRTAEQALALLARASRSAPTVMIQTFLPDHEVIRAAATGDPSIVADAERARRTPLGFPPFGALASVRGKDRGLLAAGLAGSGATAVERNGELLLRAPSWEQLSDAVLSVPKPAGASWSVHVDPPRV